MEGVERADENVDAHDPERDDAGAVGAEADRGALPAFAARGADEHGGDTTERADEEHVLRKPVGEEGGHG